MNEGWEGYLRRQFPGYLLPSSAAEALEVDEARRFLERISGRAGLLEVLAGASFLAPRVRDLCSFVRDLSIFARSLPSQSERIRREWEGGFQGRLDVMGTLALRLESRQTTFVTRATRRHRQLPENALLRAVGERVLTLLTLLRTEGITLDNGWAAGLGDAEGLLRRTLSTTALRFVESVQISQFDENAARAARHPVYQHAVSWHCALRDRLDTTDSAEIAKVVADGALLPLRDATRFELAVAIRLARAVHDALTEREPSVWKHEPSLVMPGRREMVAFVRPTDDVRVRICYNQAELPAGPVDRDVSHYLGAGRLRPDVTLVISRGTKRIGAMVVECKLTDNPSYVATGFHEAALYRWEYAPHLIPWPKSVLVTSAPVSGAAREGDEVVAVTWGEWPPPSVVAAIVSCVPSPVTTP